MNPLSIELYKRYKKDITREPLEFAVNNQHMNGGRRRRRLGPISLAGCYAVGEAAGTHGVTRPGGAALNAGQVFGLRCAEHIAANPPDATCASTAPRDLAEAEVATLLAGLARSGRRRAARRRARGAGAHERLTRASSARAAGVSAALAGARTLNARIRAEGVRLDRPDQAAKAVQWRQMALASEAVLTALDAYFAAGGGSRGARVLCDPGGAATPQTRLGPLVDTRFVPERKEDRERQIAVRRVGESFTCVMRPIRRRDRAAKASFERDWGMYLRGDVFRDG